MESGTRGAYAGRSSSEGSDGRGGRTAKEPVVLAPGSRVCCDGVRPAPVEGQNTSPTPAVNPFPTTIFPRVSSPPGTVRVGLRSLPFGSARIRGHCTTARSHTKANGDAAEKMAAVPKWPRSARHQGHDPDGLGEGCRVGARAKSKNRGAKGAGGKSGESIDDGPRPMHAVPRACLPASLPSSFRGSAFYAPVSSGSAATSPPLTPPRCAPCRRLDAVTTRSGAPAGGPAPEACPDIRLACPALPATTCSSGWATTISWLTTTPLSLVLPAAPPETATRPGHRNRDADPPTVVSTNAVLQAKSRSTWRSRCRVGRRRCRGAVRWSGPAGWVR